MAAPLVPPAGLAVGLNPGGSEDPSPGPVPPGVPPAPWLGMEAPDPDALGGQAPPPGHRPGQGSGKRWPHPTYGDHGMTHEQAYMRRAMAPPMPPPWMTMDAQQAYMAGLQEGRRNCSKPPPGYPDVSGAGQKMRRRREPSPPVPYLQAPSVDQRTLDQLRDDLESDGNIERKLEGLQQLARHRYGCRIMCRLLQRSLEELPGLDNLVEKLLREAQPQCRNIFGHYVIESLLQGGRNKHKVPALCRRTFARRSPQAGVDCTRGMWNRARAPKTAPNKSKQWAR